MFYFSAINHKSSVYSSSMNKQVVPSKNL